MQASYLREHRVDLIIIGVLLALGILTRFIGISYQSLWIDEGATYYYSQFTWEEYRATAEPNSFVYYWMQGCMFDLLGRNEFAMRCISAVCSALTVPLVYVLCQRIVGNRYVSAIAAAITLISPIMIEYGQEGRGYAPMVFLFMCQIIVLLRCLEDPKWRYWIVLAVLSALNLTMHYMSIVASFALYSYAIIYYRKEWLQKDLSHLAQVFISGILMLLISSPLLKEAIDAYREASSHEHWDWCHIGIQYFYHLMTDFLFNVEFLLLAPFALLGAYLLLKRDKEKGILVCWITGLPILLTTLASYSMNMTPRYVLWGAIGMYILMASSILLLVDDDRKIMRNAAVAGVAVMILACVCLPVYYTEVTKADFRGGAYTLEDNVQEGDTVIYSPNWENMVYGSISFYYDPIEHGATVYGVITDDEFRNCLSMSTGTVYVIILQSYEPYPLLSESAGCELIFKEYEITVWKITGPI